MKNINVQYLAGDLIEVSKPLKPYDRIVCEFLFELSKRLQKDRKAAAYPDILTFAFYCRKANILKRKLSFEDDKVRIGRGTIFHIAPSNIPINFMFSYVFGLLAGNANIVRVSTKKFEQTEIICDIMNQMFELEKFFPIKEHTAIISYEHDQNITDQLSAFCDGRVIWGGDSTIKEVRKSPIASRCVEITFADRFSFGILDAKKIMALMDEELFNLAEAFYNDTYLMDQNACSTPHLLLWKKTSDTEKAKTRFWKAVFDVANKYNLADIKVSEKYTQLIEYAIEMENIAYIHKYENLVYIIGLTKLDSKLTNYRGKYGLFFEYDIEDINEIADYVTNTVQTCAYFGVDREEIINSILDNHMMGIDRVVPFGTTLDIDVIWDGYDIVNQLSRIIG
ncbi:MAG: acyl-CoA reductase [Lachnospiraceae bacterium]